MVWDNQQGRNPGDTLIIETRNFDRRTQSFAGAGNALDKIVTERLTRVAKNTLQYEATTSTRRHFRTRS